MIPGFVAGAWSSKHASCADGRSTVIMGYDIAIKGASASTDRGYALIMTVISIDSGGASLELDKMQHFSVYILVCMNSSSTLYMPECNFI